MRVHVDSKEKAPISVSPEVSSETSTVAEETSSDNAATQEDSASTTSEATTPKDKKPPPEAAKPDSKNLSGKLNNLISSDMASLQGGQSLMMLRKYSGVI